MATWNTIHDFFRGWAMQEVIPDNFIVTEDHSAPLKAGGFHIPWKVGHNKVEPRIIYADDAQHFLGINIFAVGVNLDGVYESLIPLLRKQAEERRAVLEARGPLKFERFVIPNIKNFGKCVDIREVLSSNSIRDSLEETP